MNNHQPWLKAMQNGGLGEARAKALLLERFWVLERSVDIQGADYLIQRRLTENNFLDKEPPKLGVVQVKFIQDGKTYISIDKNYVCDENDHPYNEFFLLVFSGSEDEATSHLLTATEIVKTFSKKEQKGKIIFKIAGSKILNSSNYLIKNKSIALGKIEHALINASFISNRRFLGSTNYIKISPEQIDHDLLLPLDNGYADFQKEFYDNKKKLQGTLFDIEDVVEAMNKMLASTDPEEAYEIYNDQISYHIGSGLGTTLSFSIDFFEDEDFLTAVKNHKQRLSVIRDKGLESPFFCLMADYKKSIIQQISKLVFKKSDKIKVIARYCPETLGELSVLVSRTNDEYDEVPKINITKLGYQEIIYNPYSWFELTAYEIKKTNKDESCSTVEILEKNHWKYVRTFQVAVEKHLLGEDLVSPWM